MSDLVILTEAGGTVGYGHLMRCLAIADHMDAELYVHVDGDYPKDSNRSKDYNWRTRPGKLIGQLPAACSILVDSYLANRKIYEILSSHIDHVSVIDDYNRLEYPVDLVINPGIKLPDYSNQSAKIVGGNKYIILRKEIIQNDPKTDYSEFRHLLVTFGGCDASTIFNWLVPVLSKYSDMTITVITGNSEVCDTLSARHINSSIKWLGQVDAQHMAELMYQADVCISAGGQTLHELAYIGVPTICIETGADQKNNINGYVDAGFLLEHLLLEEKGLPIRINHLLKAYSNIDLRQRTAENGKNMVDGQGVTRIAEALYAS